MAGHADLQDLLAEFLSLSHSERDKNREIERRLVAKKGSAALDRGAGKEERSRVASQHENSIDDQTVQSKIEAPTATLWRHHCHPRHIGERQFSGAVFNLISSYNVTIRDGLRNSSRHQCQYLQAADG